MMLNTTKLLLIIFFIGIQLSNINSVPLNSDGSSKVESLVKKFTQFGNIVKGVVSHAVSQVTDAVDNRERGFKFSCTTCSFAVNLLMNYVKSGRTNEEIAKTCISLCTTFKVESEFVCRGAVTAFVHDAVHILKSSPNLKEKDICGFVIGEECETSEFESKYNWSVPLPSTPKPAPVPVVPPPDGLPTIRILHLSDTHLDPFYKVGANAVCGLPLCCREANGMPITSKNAAGKWGDYRKCDAPIELVDNMLEHISKTHQVDYIFWTGDLPPHDIYNQSKIGNVNIIKQLADILHKHFPNTLIFPALGNHEGHPVNSFPPPEVGGEFSISWLYDELSKSWSSLIQKEFDTNTIRRGAYYSVPISKGFRIISLNMNYCNTKNWWLLSNFVDPAQELKWLIDELEKAELINEKVYILGHIPPGSHDCTKAWSRNFHTIVTRFENTIAAQFYGHTHFDEVMLFYNEENERPTNIAYIGASTTPYTNLNPAYKIFTADGERANSTRAILDGESYYTNLTEANLNGSPIWRRLYSYKSDYHMQSLTPRDWDLFIRKMSQDELTFDFFLENMHRKSDAYPSCDANCRADLLCQQVTAKSKDFSVCKKIDMTLGNVYKIIFPESCWRMRPEVNLSSSNTTTATSKRMPAVPASSAPMQSHLTDKLVRGLGRMRRRNVLCDLALTCKGVEFTVHKCVLAASSEYFHAMFTNGLEETHAGHVELHEVEPDALDVLLGIIYGEQVAVHLHEDQLEPVLSAAHMLQLDPIYEYCCEVSIG
uniref:Uncharacterized protein n=1 Tax=Strigamia maritima TaxID=126957 RepID=T1JMX9_STRMM